MSHYVAKLFVFRGGREQRRRDLRPWTGGQGIYECVDIALTVHYIPCSPNSVTTSCSSTFVVPPICISVISWKQTANASAT